MTAQRGNSAQRCRRRKVIAQEPSTMKQKIDSVTKAEKPKR